MILLMAAIELLTRNCRPSAHLALHLAECWYLDCNPTNVLIACLLPTSAYAVRDF